MRNVAYHVPLLFVSNAVEEDINGIMFYRLPNGSLVKRVHVWGTVMNKIVGDEYVRITIDDLTGTTSVVFFGDMVQEAMDVDVGDRVDIIGRLRTRNEEIGIVGETLKKIGPKVELLRRLENLAFALGVPTVEEVVPAPVASQEESVEKEEEEIEVETLDLEGDEW